MKVVFIN